MKKVIDVTSKRMFVKDEHDYRFLNLSMYAIREGINRNGTSFTLDSMKKALPSFYNMPILAYYNPKIKDCEEHNKDYSIDLETFDLVESYLPKDTEKACGLIRESDTVEIVEYKGANWIRLTGAIWSKYNRELARMLRSSVIKKISVEIKIEKKHEENGIEVIDEFVFCGVTILGDHIPEGIKDAHLLVTDTIKEDKKNKFVFSMKKAFAENKDDNSERDINVALTRDKASNDDWGEVDKTKLRNDLLNAKNSAQLIRACYLYVGKDYINTPSEELKYPICQIKNGELVYNVNGVESASSFLMKNKDEPYFAKVLSKLNNVRKKLGLKPIGRRKKEVKRMSLENRDILFEKDQFTFFVSESDDEKSKVYVAEKLEDGSEKVFAVDAKLSFAKDVCDDDDDDKHDDHDDKTQQITEEVIEDDDDDDKEDKAERFLAECDFAEIAKMACKERELAKEETKTMAEKLDKTEKEAKAEKEAKEEVEKKFRTLSAETISDKFELKEEEKKEIVEMACEKKMSLDEIEKEVVFLQFSKGKNKFKESIIRKEEKETKDVFDELNNI